MKFSFKYPSDWFVKEIDRGIVERGFPAWGGHCYDYEIIYTKNKKMKIKIKHVCGATGERAVLLDSLINIYQYLSTDDNKMVDILRLYSGSYFDRTTSEYVYSFEYVPFAGSCKDSYLNVTNAQCRFIFYRGLTEAGQVFLEIPGKLFSLDEYPNTPATRNAYLKTADKIVLSIRKL